MRAARPSAAGLRPAAAPPRDNHDQPCGPQAKLNPIGQTMRRTCRLLRNRHNRNRRNNWNDRSRDTRDDSTHHKHSIIQQAGDLTMKRFQWLQYAATGIASLGFALPSGLSAAEARRTPLLASATETPSILDVSLGDGAALSGQVLDAQGAPLAQTTVTVRRFGADVASAVTDTQGWFSVRGLQGGVHEVTCGGSSAVCRAWTADASPPSANKSILIVAGGPVSRGQYPPRQFPSGPRPSGPRPLPPITNGQVVIAGLLVLGAAGAIVGIALGTQEQPSGS